MQYSVASKIDKAPYLVEVSRGRYNVNFTSSSSKEWSELVFTALLGHHDLNIEQPERSDFAKRHTLHLLYYKSSLWDATVGPALASLDTKFKKLPFSKRTKYSNLQVCVLTR